MEPEFWLERWERGEIGFHQETINCYLSDHWAALGVAEGATVFVPLCGKSRDMLWLRDQGHPVIGVELSEQAVRAFFDENRIDYRCDEVEGIRRYRGGGFTIYAADLFTLTQTRLEGAVAVYDRASLVALPPGLRERYVAKLAGLLPAAARLLLVSLDYADGALQGPPFAVAEEEVVRLFTAQFHIERLGGASGEGPKGVMVDERVYLLTRRG